MRSELSTQLLAVPLELSTAPPLTTRGLLQAVTRGSGVATSLWYELLYYYSYFFSSLRML